MTFVWPPEWHDRAACRGKGTELFFPETAGQGHLYEALRICRSCPVEKDCADWAFDNNELFGIWGGKSCRQRRLQRRKKLIPETATCAICGKEYAPTRVGAQTCSTECMKKNTHRTQRERRAAAKQAKRGAA